MKFETENNEKVCRRDNMIVITTAEGKKEKYFVPGMEDSPCLPELKRLPNYKTARREATRIARHRWESVWWRKQFLKSEGQCGEYKCINLRDYITARLLEEGSG